MPTSQARSLKTEGPDRRADAIRATQTLIVEKGFEGLRVREVAARAGMHHATLLHYFPTKEALIQGVIEAFVSRLDRVPADAQELSPRDALHAHFKLVLEQMRTAPQQFTVINELLVRASRDEKLHKVLADTDMAWRTFLVPLLARGAAEGAFRQDLEPEATATVITSTFKGFAFELTLTPELARKTMDQLERWIIGDA